MSILSNQLKPARAHALLQLAKNCNRVLSLGAPLLARSMNPGVEEEYTADVAAEIQRVRTCCEEQLRTLAALLAYLEDSGSRPDDPPGRVLDFTQGSSTPSAALCTYQMSTKFLPEPADFDPKFLVTSQPIFLGHPKSVPQSYRTVTAVRRSHACMG